MHDSFVASILYSNAAKLECLKFDDLQQIGKGCHHFLDRRADQRAYITKDRRRRIERLISRDHSSLSVSPVQSRIFSALLAAANQA